MVNASKMLIGAAVLAVGLGTPALAEVHHGHGVRHAKRVHVGGRRVVRVVRVVGPAQYVAPQPLEYDDPAYVHGVDDGSRYDTSTDGIGIGREGDLIQRPQLAGRYRGPGLELEGPPIGASLPVVPELIDPSLY